MKKEKSNRCEGWRRRGGAFTLGPVSWSQCKEPGVVLLKFKDKESGKISTLPACMTCWDECRSTGVKILESKPITKK